KVDAMSTNSPEQNSQSLAADDDHGSTLDHKETLQKVVVDLARYGPGRSTSDLRDRLEVAIAEAGLSPQPRAWVEAVAQEASLGHVTVLDARFARQDDDESRSDEDAAGPGGGPDIGPNG